MKRILFAVSALALFASAASAQAIPETEIQQAPVTLVKVEKVPWPGPDTWNPNRHEEYKGGHWLTAEKLLSAKSVYIQSALPPEDAGAPEWVAQRYKVTGPSDAELFIFMVSRSEKRTNSSRDLSDAMNVMAGNKVHDHPIEMIPVYYILVTDRNGVRVMTARGEEYTLKAWDRLLFMIRFEEKYQEKQSQKKC